MLHNSHVGHFFAEIVVILKHEPTRLPDGPCPRNAFLWLEGPGRTPGHPYDASNPKRVLFPAEYLQDAEELVDLFQLVQAAHPDRVFVCLPVPVF